MPFVRPKLKSEHPKVAKAPKQPGLARFKAPQFLQNLRPTTVGESHARTQLDGAIVRPVFTREELINAESELGRHIFGPIPAGHQREFFQLEKNVWVWHESWTEKDEKHETTMRYEVRENGVYKKLQAASADYTRVEGQELENFRQALHLYLALIKEKLY